MSWASGCICEGRGASRCVWQVPLMRERPVRGREAVTCRVRMTDGGNTVPDGVLCDT